MALNNSVSKHQFSFSKSSRFPSLKQNTKNISHSVFDKPSDFDKTKNFPNATTFGFGSHESRFRNHNTSVKNQKMPSPVSYETQPRTFSPDVSRSKGWSLGLGRDVVQKKHIDAINDEAGKKLASPSPDSYEKKTTFSKEGTFYSMRKRLNRYGSRVDRYDNHYFDQEKKLPGPGYYIHPETVGTRMMSSTFVSSRQSSIPKAQDRFMAPTIHKTHPSPNQYQPKADIVQHVKSNHPKVQMTRFGLDTSSILNHRWNTKQAQTTPGPGDYGRWSDFSKTVN